MDRDQINAESPYDYPFVMLDRIESYDAKQHRLVGVKCVPRNEPLLQGHFPGFPIFPGVLLIECLAQAAGALLKLDAGWPAAMKLLLADSRIKHIRPVYPGDRVTLECEVVARTGTGGSFRVRALVEGEEITKGRLALERYVADS